MMYVHRSQLHLSKHLIRSTLAPPMWGLIVFAVGNVGKYAVEHFFGGAVWPRSHVHMQPVTHTRHHLLNKFCCALSPSDGGNPTWSPVVGVHFGYAHHSDMRPQCGGGKKRVRRSAPRFIVSRVMRTITAVIWLAVMVSSCRHPQLCHCTVCICSASFPMQRRGVVVWECSCACLPACFPLAYIALCAVPCGWMEQP